MHLLLPLGRAFGIPIHLHYSLSLIVPFLAWRLATDFLPTRYEGWTQTTYWLTGFIAVGALFISILIHELAHSLVARQRGYTVNEITLFILGGVSSITSETSRAKDEFIISVVGPLISLGAGLVFGAFYSVTYQTNNPIAALIFYLALINIVLAAFNIVPAFPLDGGRVLRSAIWALTGSFVSATNISTRISQVIGAVLVLIGVLEVFQGFLLQGVWTGLIGWFVYRSATGIRKEETI